MRATIDLDDPTDIEVMQAWSDLEDAGDGHVKGRVSSSGSGVHLKVHGCDEATVRRLRELHDDQKRQRFDRDSELKPEQILFSSKPTGQGASDWTDDLDHLLAVYERRAPKEVRNPGFEPGHGQGHGQ